MTINTDACSKIIYEHGEFVCISEMTKSEANLRCQELSDSEENEYLYDWHFIAGRVRILKLHKDSPHLKTEA